jgi:hypothetical protein
VVSHQVPHSTCETRRLVTVFKRPHHWSLPCAISNQYTSYPISLFSILILLFHTRLDMPSYFFASGLPSNILYAVPVFGVHATCSTHPTLLDLITAIVLCEVCNFRKSSSPLHFIRYHKHALIFNERSPYLKDYRRKWQRFETMR